jgi:hypothetical protein
VSKSQHVGSVAASHDTPENAGYVILLCSLMSAIIAIRFRRAELSNRGFDLWQPLAGDIGESELINSYFGCPTRRSSMSRRSAASVLGSLSLHLATFLAREARVLLVDVDHQSSLSIVVLGAPLWEKCVTKLNTVNRIFESFCKS